MGPWSNTIPLSLAVARATPLILGLLGAIVCRAIPEFPIPFLTSVLMHGSEDLALALAR